MSCLISATAHRFETVESCSSISQCCRSLLTEFAVLVVMLMIELYPTAGGKIRFTFHSLWCMTSSIHHPWCDLFLQMHVLLFNKLILCNTKRSQKHSATHINSLLARPKSAKWFSGLWPRVDLQEIGILSEETVARAISSCHADLPRSPLFPFVSSMESKQSISASPGRVFICLRSGQIPQYSDTGLGLTLGQS